MFETQRKALIEAENNKHLYKKMELRFKACRTVFTN